MRLKHNTKEKWTHKEDATLLQLFAEHGANWKIIAEHFPRKMVNNLDRSARIVQEHYVNYVDPKIDHSPWSL